MGPRVQHALTACSRAQTDSSRQSLDLPIEVRAGYCSLVGRHVTDVFKRRSKNPMEPPSRRDNQPAFSACIQEQIAVQDDAAGHVAVREHEDQNPEHQIGKHGSESLGCCGTFLAPGRRRDPRPISLAARYAEHDRRTLAASLAAKARRVCLGRRAGFGAWCAEFGCCPIPASGELVKRAIDGLVRKITAPPRQARTLMDGSGETGSGCNASLLVRKCDNRITQNDPAIRLQCLACLEELQRLEFGTHADLHTPGKTIQSRVVAE